MKVVNPNISSQIGYQVLASVNQDFYSSDRRLVYQVQQENELLFLNKEGHQIAWPIGNFVFQANLQPLKGSESKTIPLSGLSDNLRPIQDAAKEILRQKFSRRVYYQGYRRGLSRYCQISQKAVAVNDLRPICLHFYEFGLQVQRHRYSFLALFDGEKTLVLAEDLRNCQICRKYNKKLIYICNDCGASCHPPRPFFWFGHSFKCRPCSKTICARCSRRRSFFKRRVCLQCFALPK